MNAVIYARSSFEGVSVERQIRECSKYAEENGFEIIGVYTDYTESALNTNRSQFKKMLEDGQSGLFDVIIFYSLDRFSRKREEVEMFRKKLKLQNIELLSVTESNPEDLGGMIFESIITGVAEGCLAGYSFEVKLI